MKAATCGGRLFLPSRHGASLREPGRRRGSAQQGKLERRGFPHARAPGSIPQAAKGCLRSASSGTGASASTAACATRRKKTPGGVSESGTPAESSTEIDSVRAPPRRAARARDRASPMPPFPPAFRARPQNERDRFGFERGMRRCDDGERKRRVNVAVKRGAALAQPSVASAGRKASASRRARGALPRAVPSGHMATASRAISRPASKDFIAPCGWLSPTSAQVCSSSAWSRPGNTTAPSGM